MTEAATFESSPTQARTRRWRRYKVGVPLRVIVCHARKASIFDARGTAVSEGGMALFAGTELHPGDQVAVEFTPPFSAPPIRVDARICNRTGYTYGVEFLTDSSTRKQEADRIRNHLSSLTGIAASND
jgi:hypothetical protein